MSSSCPPSAKPQFVTSVTICQDILASEPYRTVSRVRDRVLEGHLKGELQTLRMPFAKMHRRHSIAVGLGTNPKLPDERRGSFQSDLKNLTKSMSAGLNLLQRRLSRDNFFGDSELCPDKALVQAALVKHYGDDTIEVKIVARLFLIFYFLYHVMF